MSHLASFKIADGAGKVLTAKARFASADTCDEITMGLPRASEQGSLLDDAIEYVRLSVKRWKYYFNSGFAVGTREELFTRVRQEPSCEVGFMLQVSLPDGTKVGGCFARRTWAGNILLDFLFTHPNAFVATKEFGEISQFKGVGVGIMTILAGVTLEIGGTELWGEATENSAGFYQKLKSKLGSTGLDANIADRFIFRKHELIALSKQID